MKTVCPEGRVGSNPTLSAGALTPRSTERNPISYRSDAVKRIFVVCRSTQEAEGTPLERVQVVNSGARVQIPPSALAFPNRNANQKELEKSSKSC